MIKVTFILEELGTFGAALDAGVAFDAGPGNRGHIRRVDGAHRADSGAYSAVNAFGAGHWLDLAYVYEIALSVPWLIVACLRVSCHLHRRSRKLLRVLC